MNIVRKNQQYTLFMKKNKDFVCPYFLEYHMGNKSALFPFFDSTTGYPAHADAVCINELEYEVRYETTDTDMLMIESYYRDELGKEKNESNRSIINNYYNIIL